MEDHVDVVRCDRTVVVIVVAVPACHQWHPSAVGLYWSRCVGMLCAAAGSICLSDYLFVLFAGVCVVRCVVVLCGVMVDVLVASVVIWYLHWVKLTGVGLLPLQSGVVLMMLFPDPTTQPSVMFTNWRVRKPRQMHC